MTYNSGQELNNNELRIEKEEKEVLEQNVSGRDERQEVDKHRGLIFPRFSLFKSLTQAHEKEFKKTSYFFLNFCFYTKWEILSNEF